MQCGSHLESLRRFVENIQSGRGPWAALQALCYPAAGAPRGTALPMHSLMHATSELHFVSPTMSNSRGTRDLAPPGRLACALRSAPRPSREKTGSLGSADSSSSRTQSRRVASAGSAACRSRRRRLGEGRGVRGVAGWPLAPLAPRGRGRPAWPGGGHGWGGAGKGRNQSQERYRERRRQLD